MLCNMVYYIHPCVRELPNPLQIEQHSDNMNSGLSLFPVCLHFGLCFWLRGGNFKWLIILLIIASPT